jgi:hypothetical protein
MIPMRLRSLPSVLPLPLCVLVGFVLVTSWPGCLAKVNDPPDHPVEELDQRTVAVTPGPTLEYVRSIFAKSCTNCHAGAFASEGLTLTPCGGTMTSDTMTADTMGQGTMTADAGSASAHCDLTDLVNVSSTEIPGRLRVKPGDPDNSYLVDKLRDQMCSLTTCGAGCPPGTFCQARMPYGGPYLSDSDINFVAEWVRSLGADGGVPDAGTPSDLITGDVPVGPSDLATGDVPAAPSDLTGG